MIASKQKKLITIFAALGCVLSFIASVVCVIILENPILSSASDLTSDDGCWTYTVVDEDMKTAELTGVIDGIDSDGTLDIPETIDGYMIVSIGADCCSNDSTIVKIIIPAGVTTIGENAFLYCSELTSVEFSDSGNLEILDKYSFGRCTKLNNVVIPEGVTTIKANAFVSDSKLSDLTIPSTVTFFGGGAFWYTPWLTTMRNSSENYLVIINNVLVDGVLASGEVEVPSGVTTIAESAFYGPNATSSSTTPSSAQITKVTLPDTVTCIYGAAFYGCTTLETITLSDNITEIWGNTFTGCTGLSEITLPLALVNLYSTAFNNLEITVYIPYDFENTAELPLDSLTTVTIVVYENSAAATYLYYQTTINYYVESESGELVEGKHGEETDTSEEDDTSGDDTTEEVDTSDSGTTAATTSETTTESTSDEATTTESTVVTGGSETTTTESTNTTGGSETTTTESTKTTDSTSETTTETTTGSTTNNITNNTTNNTTNITNSTTNNTYGTSTISISEATVTLSKNSYNYNGKAKKPAVKSVTLKGETLTAGTDYVVSYKNNKNIGTATVVITGKGDYDGTALKTFTIKIKKGAKYTVGKYKYKILSSGEVSFVGVKSKKVKKVVIPKSVTIGGKKFKVTAVAKNALKGNKKVTKIVVGNNVKTIGAGAFRDCTKLKQITFGKSVKKIGKSVLYGDSNLATINFKGKKLKSIGKHTFTGVPTTAKINVPTSKIALYKKLINGAK